MARPAPGMGRGLSAILAVSTEQADATAERVLRELPVESIEPNPDQPRRSFDPDAMRALADSLLQRGVLQPVLVRPRGEGRYELIAGERRWRAAQIAGLARIPALVHAHDDAATLELALVENMVREDLNPVEQARACAALVEDLGLTREEVGGRVGKSRAAISNLIRLLDLPDEVLDSIAAGGLSEGHGRALLLTADHGRRRELARIASERELSVRALEALARQGPANGTRRRPRVAADHEQAARGASDRLASAIGTGVRVLPQGDAGFKVEFSLSSVAEIEALLARIAAPR